ncbi:hypothetical protein KQ876_03435 [Mycoplasma sp. CSL7491-lung]|uniref:hypothetical protein n=1 Tax=Mycoplasma sp. CSL7491-lung TaxID=549718 RepID=UPI001C107883|nr:hypothetical protein [Mycoplasma sp. CSL7491-lung]MBU4693241.1 hypothetical protein [Mycoplasma sp. CSL7491-lung]
MQKKSSSNFNISKLTTFVNVSRTTFYYEQRLRIIKEKWKANIKLIDWILE